MKLKIGYLKQFIQLFGLSKGTKLYFNISRGKFAPFSIPGVKQPIKLRKDTSDLRTFYQVFINNEYNVQIPFHPEFIVDGGANIGLFSILMTNKFPNAKIVSIEPDLDNFNTLTENIKGYTNCVAENAGLWHRNTPLKVYDKYDSGAWGMVVEESETGNINAISIDYLMEKHKIKYIDILKLDIETSEKVLFSENFENWLPKTRMIIIELHDWLKEGCSKTFFMALNQMINNYELITSGENVIIINKDLHQPS